MAAASEIPEISAASSEKAGDPFSVLRLSLRGTFKQSAECFFQKEFYAEPFV